MSLAKKQAEKLAVAAIDSVLKTLEIVPMTDGPCKVVDIIRELHSIRTNIVLDTAESYKLDCNRQVQALTLAVTLGKGELPQSKDFYTANINGQVIAFKQPPRP